MLLFLLRNICTELNWLVLGFLEEWLWVYRLSGFTTKALFGFEMGATHSTGQTWLVRPARTVQPVLPDVIKFCIWIGNEHIGTMQLKICILFAVIQYDRRNMDVMPIYIWQLWFSDRVVGQGGRVGEGGGGQDRFSMYIPPVAAQPRLSNGSRQRETEWNTEISFTY